MSLIQIYFVIFFSQFLFNIGKVLEIKLTYENKTSGLLLNSIFINLVSLISTYFSIDSLFGGDLLVVFFYVAGSVCGKWIAMTKFENYRAKLFKWLSH
jgi:hypothetical protein